MVILAIDYGDTRTGFAYCGKDEILASPCGTVTEKDPAKLRSIIIEKAKEYGAEMFVLGLPKNMDGSEGFRSDAVREFGEALKNESGLPLEYSDERLTTVSAHNYLNATNTRGKKRKDVVDTVSAVIILGDFLLKRKNGIISNF